MKSTSKLVAGFSTCAIVLCGLISNIHAETASPNRIVSVGGSITEIIYTLGEESRIVGVDTTSLWPLAATKIPKVGYQRNLSAEGILSLTPDLVIVTEDAGPPAVIKQIRNIGVEVEVVESSPDIDGITDKILSVADVLGVREAGANLVDKTISDLHQLETSLQAVKHKPSVLFLLSVGRGAPLVAGHETSANGIIKLAGGVNAISSFDGYKPLNTEALVAAKPDFILTTKRTLKLIGGEESLLELPGIGQTPAALKQNIISMDGLFLLGFGSRSPAAATELARNLHPQLIFDGE